jgi:heme/copper-type cytochrome/quinol oxidase subunit 2
MTPHIGGILIIFGIVLIIIGFLLTSTNIGKHLGKLPGDINIKRENVSFHFPIVTCILISIILTILINLFFRK